ncbi:MAG: dinitrogenase iron-molybdenum cofactor biosynthesis protein [Oscillospiraceae bacterium]|jgi:nitrogen fixation protein NifX|nr:dinitrogenase iron-molybdenum cofactor biosynthesis protein [Oscillospiraceae bacterium]MCI1990168.1 dinitrogenase iron-molybdenum cofactor biosynthesis protein [Oscillospiraceae bacterium]MCI2034875.1 dinitrogenase iron-molybdenum cofactor biosynthesis protein [Oscillospiraceae bacterium]
MKRSVVPGRVAAASSDGVTVNLHFGQAQEFYIYDVRPEGWKFVERRDIRRTLGHDTAEFDKVRLMLGDCEAVLVSRIGPAAAEYLLVKGLRVFQAPYRVDAVLNRLAQLNLLGREGKT